jgi:Septum formation
MTDRWVCKRCYADNEGMATTCVRCGLQRGADVSVQAQQEWHAQAQPAGPPPPAWRGLLRYAWIPVVGIVLVVGYVLSQGQRDLENLAVGDCFDAADAETISEIDAGPCTDPHEYEAYLVFDHQAGSFPGSAGFEAVFQSECLPAFDPYVGAPYASSDIYASMITPTEESWANGDREVVCVIYDPNEPQLTSSLRDAGR